MPDISTLTVASTTFNLKDNISGYVKGNGTSTYLAEWSGASTLENGPKITSGHTTYFLREDGSWKLPNQIADSYPPAYQLVIQGDGNLVMYDKANDTAVWQTGQSGKRVRPLMIKTVSGNTNTNGNISLALAPGTYTVWSVIRTDDNNTACIPFQGGSNWYARCLQANTPNHAVRASTSVTLRVVYSNTKALIDDLNT